MDNTTGLLCLSEMGRTGSKTFDQGDFQVPLGLSDHDYCRLPPKSIKCKDSLAILNCREPLGWKICQKLFPQKCQSSGIPQIELFASQLSLQLPQLIAWKTRPHLVRRRYITRNLDQISPLTFPSFCLIPQFLRKVDQNQNIAYHTKFGVTSPSLMESPSLVSKFNGNISSSTITTYQEHSLERPKRGNSPSSCKRNFAFSSIAHTREKRILKGVLETSTQLITRTGHKSLEGNYN